LLRMKKLQQKKKWDVVNNATIKLQIGRYEPFYIAFLH
jgi:hypothetical protein